ncbi:helix-turn-helix domain-containing protein [Saccharopolyspora pogona]|uniref:helix-turn-helix domain-containing protein n=1 Tax=Saccharopolyspora pogona TaxID=333966 RepID=UPI001681E84D|nr:helix-turn-helix transcriptional regulator [Saccharopolyspora pogona]
MGDAPLTVGSYALGNRLRRYRTEIGLSAADVARTVGVTQPTVTRIERGKHRLTPKQLTSLCEIYELSPDDRATLEEVRVTATKPDWRQDYQQLIDGPLGDVLGLETGATKIRGHDGQLILGLLQTEEYATSLMQEAPYIRAVEIQRRVALRMRRQEGVLHGRQELIAVIGEGALRQQVGGIDVMRRQIAHLRDLSERDNIMIRMLPYTAGAHAALGSAFNILDFDSTIDLPTVVCVDTLTSALIYEQPERVETFTQSFDMMMVRTLGETETIKQLDQIDCDLKKQGP